MIRTRFFWTVSHLVKHWQIPTTITAYAVDSTSKEEEKKKKIRKNKKNINAE